MREVIDVLKGMVGEVLAIDPGGIRPDKPLIEYGMDSVRTVDLVVRVEEQYGVQVSDSDVAKIRTLRDVETYLRARLPA